MKRITIRCPRCHGNSIQLCELYDAAVYVYAKNGILVEPHCMNLEPGDIIGLWAKCLTCSHQWKVRKANQWPDVFEELPQGEK